MILASVLMVM